MVYSGVHSTDRGSDYISNPNKVCRGGHVLCQIGSHETCINARTTVLLLNDFCFGNV
jgi:hypothetical protein